jgi:hypothetical protein
MLGLPESESPKGLIFGLDLSGVVILEVLLFPESEMGINMFRTDEIQTAGFLIRSLKSNFEAFFSALDKPGAKRKRKPMRATRATSLKKGFFCIGGLPFTKLRSALQKDGKEDKG